MTKKYVKISKPIGNQLLSCVVSMEDSTATVLDEFEYIYECGCVGDKLIIELIEMDEEDFKNGEEFQGW